MKTILNHLWKLALLGAALSLASCNTVQGLGEDIEGAGRAIEGSAEPTY